jgi:arginyl-tRNA--protein-N-Asp/Glu arginylyltransferase
VDDEPEPHFLRESAETSPGRELTDDFQLRLAASPEEMDEAWANGWRHFGPLFFRTLITVHDDKILHLRALRIVISRFEPSKSQRRVVRRNADLQISFEPAVLTAELRQMFRSHARRFTSNIPDRLENFLGDAPGKIPCETLLLAVRDGKRLVAASFLDIGKTAVSSVYGMFDPAESDRSLGTFTMLEEIAYARRHGFRYYYHGYASEEPSHYDYKKLFTGIECFDWRGNWHAVGSKRQQHSK